ncbi:siderophore-interacting protein [Actinoallomurus sp. CA-142502]|uniref:siderophore-interacting protein n=1 Tax=Actinoallomurus sp. CA-142502 TaxID=3239885 RepID=UPI003D8E530B
MAPAATRPRTAPFCFFDVHVVRAELVGRTMRRITFGGEGLAGLTCGGRDQRVKLFLPHRHQETPAMPGGDDDWYPRWCAMDPDVRAVMRTYTVCGQRREPEEFDVEFALHGDRGPASRWAASARPGDRVAVLGPTAADNGGVDFRPPPDTGWVLLAADETALPAVAGILSWLPPGTRTRAWIEVPHADDIRRLPTEADAEITWLVRGQAAPARPTVDAIRDAALPAGTPYAWIAGEAGSVRALRRHLVGERGFDRRAVKFTGYWRRGASEEDLLAEAARAS